MLSNILDLSLAHKRTTTAQALAVVLGTVILTLSSYLQVPMFPVPMTMQTYAVPLVGALFGWRLGALTVLAWLLEGACGMPVFAGGQAGAALFIGPTAGYLVSFPLAAAMVGLLAERGWTGNRWVLSFLAFALANLLSLMMGAAWLASLIGVRQALLVGFAPFVLGGLLKSALGAATMWRPRAAS